MPPVGFVTATFAKQSYTLTMSGGTGVDTLSPGSGTTYVFDDHLEVSATALPGYVFTGWTGPGAGNLDNASLATTYIANPTYSHTDITATFAKQSYTLTMSGGTGVDTLSPGSGTTYVFDDHLEVSATALPGYVFTGWTGPGAGNLDNASLATTYIANPTYSHTDITATFAKQSYTLTMSGGTGVDTLSPGSGTTYVFDDHLEVSATALPGYVFTGWTGPGAGNLDNASLATTYIANPTYSHTDITATFAKQSYTLTMSGGTGVDTLSPGSGTTYVFDDHLEVSATALPGYVFTGWTGPGAGNLDNASLATTYIANPTYSHTDITATFAKQSYTLTMSGGTGVDTLSPGSGTTYVFDDHLEVSATALPGYVFTGWTGPGAGNLDNASLATTYIANPTYSHTDITATFAKQSYTLTMSGGTGVDTLSPGSGTTYVFDDHLEVSATALPGYVFTGWTGPGAGNLDNASLATTYIANPTYSHTDITATFAKQSYTLTMSGGTGVDTLSPGSGTTYVFDDHLEVSATALPGYVFTGWTGPGAGNLDNASLATTYIANPTYSHTDITATFAKQSYTLTMSGGTGVDTLSPGSGTTYVFDDHLEVSATALPGYVFTGWTGPGAGNLDNASLATTYIANPTYSHTDITATFAKQSYTLTMSGGTGVDTLSPGSGTTYVFDDHLEVSATALPGYVFTGWTGPGAGNLDNASLATTYIANPTYSHTDITATFAKQSYTLTWAVNGNGTVTPASGTTYVFDESLAVAATPAAGWQFVNWTGAGATNLVDPNSANTSIINPTAANTDLTANFILIEYTLTVNRTGGMGTGIVSVSPSQATYHYGDVVTITAGEGAGETFANWSGDLSGNNNPETLTISDNHTVTANYNFIEYNLNISINEPFPGGGTSVLKSPDQATYHYGETVTLTPVAGSGEEFDSWSGDGINDGASPPNRVIYFDGSGDMSATVNFKKKLVQLTMQKTGDGSGDTNPSTDPPGPIYFGMYYWGDVVTVTATPVSTSSVFVGWSGNVVPTGANTGEVTMNGDQVVTANFDLRTFTVTFEAGPNGTLSPGGVTQIIQSVKYGYDTSMVTAVPDEHYHFLEWTGDVTGNQPDLTINNVMNDMTITANFEIDKFTVKFTGGNFGNVCWDDPISGSNVCGNEYTEEVPWSGSSSAVTADPDDQHQFTGWTGDLTSSDNPLVVSNVVADMVVTFDTVADINGCATDVAVGYNGVFNESDFDMVNTSVDVVTGHMKLDTGNQAIVPDKVVVPFTQDVYVTFLYEGAGYVSDFGWMLYEDAVDGSGNFLGWNNIPLSKKHVIYRNIRDDAETAAISSCCGGGDGILDTDSSLGSFPIADEAALATYDDGTGIPFHVDLDGTVTPKDMKKKLGKFVGGTEIVFWITANRDWNTTDEGLVFYNKPWNPDSYDECVPPSGHSQWVDESNRVFDKIYHLGTALGGESGCRIEGNWLADSVFNRMDTYFGVTLSGDYSLRITEDEHYPHVIVGAPPTDPNQWILGFEDLNADWGGSDMDHNDMVFHIERKTGGMARLESAQAIVPNEANAYFTAVDFKVYDYLPGGSCLGKTSSTYYVSADDGAHWTEITAWDKVHESNSSKDILTAINPLSWTPGDPEYTYRTRRVDFLGLGLTGNKLVWKVELVSENQACVPAVVDVQLNADTASHGIFSRSSPVIQTNVLYAGTYETPAPSWPLDERVNRGEVTASRVYDPEVPNATLTGDQSLWKAGEMLAAMSPDNRTIYFPNITVYQVVDEPLINPATGTPWVGNGSRDDFHGTLLHPRVQATTVRIYDTRPEVFSDEHTDHLKGSLGGTGTIKRFTGEYAVKFNTPPAMGVPIMASYSYYISSSTLQTFTGTNVDNNMLALTNDFINPIGYIHDFNGGGTFGEEDGDWLVEWVRGYKQPNASVQKAWKLGPIDHSTPALLVPPGFPLWYFGSQVTDAEREAFTNFQTAHDDRDAVLFVGSRDGMLHAFDAGKYRYGDNPDTPGIKENRGYFLWADKTGTEPSYCDAYPFRCPNYGTGKELWAFIPANLIPRLKNNVLHGDDQAFVDASPALSDVFVDTNGDGSSDTWKTVLLSAEGNGGDTVFCLDVTDPHNPSFMWEFAAPELFRSRSSPAVAQIGRIKDPDGTNEAKWVAFFVTGKVENANLFPSIYMIDVSNGSVLRKVILDDAVDLNDDGTIDATETDYGKGGVPSGQPAIVDSDENGFIDRLYLASDRGLMYKVNIPDDPSNPTTWDITHCVLNTDFVDDDFNTIPAAQRWHPVYASPAIVVKNGLKTNGDIDYKIMVFFGTGDSPITMKTSTH